MQTAATSTRSVDQTFPRLPVLIDPLEWCLAHGKITPQQYEVGLRFRKLYERAETPSVPAIDYVRPRVDRSPMPVDARSSAALSMDKAAVYLGQSAYSHLRLLVGQGRPITEVAATVALQTGEPLREASAHVRMALRSALDDLARHWGAS